MTAEGISRRWIRARPWIRQWPSPLQFRLLWALALEIDERVATRTGEQVCRACGGRGDVIVAWYPNGTHDEGARRGIDDRISDRYKVDSWVDSWTSPGDGDGPPACMPNAIAEYNASLGLALVTDPCPCDGPTRPVTVSLHQVVEAMSTRPPRGSFTYRPVSDIPDRWLVDVDAMEAAGWRDVVLPSTKADHAARCEWWRENANRLSTPAERDDNGSDPQPHHPGRQGPRVTPAWQCRWWRAWSAWARGGETPDDEALARDLRRLLPALEARAEARRPAFSADWLEPDWLDRAQMGGIQVRYPQRVLMLDVDDGDTLRARCETLAAEAGIDPDALWSAAEELSRTTASNFEDALEGIAATHGLMGTVGRALLPAFEDLADAVAEILAGPAGLLELSVGYETPATAAGLLSRIANIEVDPAEPQRGGPPIGGKRGPRGRPEKIDPS